MLKDYTPPVKALAMPVVFGLQGLMVFEWQRQ
jgi:hypothetical protein